MGKKFLEIPIGVPVNVNGSFSPVFIPVILFGSPQSHLVRDQRTHPIVQMTVVFFQIECSALGGGDNIFSFVDLVVHPHKHFFRCPLFELPKTHRIGSGDGIWDQTALLDNQVLQVLWYPVFSEYPLDSGHIKIDPVKYDLEVTGVSVQSIHIQLDFPLCLVVEAQGHVRKLYGFGDLWGLCLGTVLEKVKNKKKRDNSISHRG